MRSYNGNREAASGAKPVAKSLTDDNKQDVGGGSPEAPGKELSFDIAGEGHVTLRTVTPSLAGCLPESPSLASDSEQEYSDYKSWLGALERDQKVLDTLSEDLAALDELGGRIDHLMSRFERQIMAGRRRAAKATLAGVSKLVAEMGQGNPDTTGSQKELMQHLQGLTDYVNNMPLWVSLALGARAVFLSAAELFSPRKATGGEPGN
jgi:hypothetical protein